MDKSRTPVYLLSILIIGLIFFRKTFNLALFGDEWQLFWMIKSAFINQGKWVIIRPDFSPYQPGGMIIYLWTEILHSYSGRPVYITAFVLRFLAIVSFYFFLLRTGMVKVSATLGALLFMITPIGIEATDWAKNQVSYITIMLLFISLNTVLNLKNTKNLLKISFASLLAIITNPIRAPGMILTTSIALSLLLLEKKSVNKKIVWLAMLIPVGLILLASQTVLKSSGGFADVKTYLTTGSISLKNLNDFIFTLGNGLTPSFDYQKISSLILFFLIFVWKRNAIGGRVSNLLFAIITSLVILTNSLQTALVTGYLFVLTLTIIALFELSLKRFDEFKYTLICLLIAVSFNIAAFLKTPFIKLTSEHRYLIFTALVLPMIIAFSTNQVIKNKNRFLKSLVYLAVSIIFIIQLIIIKKVIDDMYFKHNQIYSDKIWNQIVEKVQDKDTKSTRLAFFFIYDDPESVQNAPTALEFGFFYHYGVFFNIWDESKLPIILSSKEEVISAVTDGKASAKNDGKAYKFPREDIYILKVNSGQISRENINDYI